ncbi:hypothetical protein AC630_36270 [Bradyrhizobium sp. AS23.2]|nr:hypothetical protein AC630_36270 [Bradyrhizobium sp. AS23.2]
MNKIKLTAPRHRISDDAAVAISVILFKAKQTCNGFSRGGHSLGESLLRCSGQHMSREYSSKIGEATLPRRDAARFGIAEPLQMQITDASIIQPFGERGLGEARLPGDRYVANINQ